MRDYINNGEGRLTRLYTNNTGSQDCPKRKKDTTESGLRRLFRVVRWSMVKQRAVHMQVHSSMRQRSIMVNIIFQHDDSEMLYNKKENTRLHLPALTKEKPEDEMH